MKWQLGDGFAAIGPKRTFASSNRWPGPRRRHGTSAASSGARKAPCDKRRMRWAYRSIRENAGANSAPRKARPRAGLFCLWPFKNLRPHIEERPQGAPRRACPRESGEWQQASLLPWFETYGFAALLTMRSKLLRDQILNRMGNTAITALPA